MSDGSPHTTYFTLRTQGGDEEEANRRRRQLHSEYQIGREVGYKRGWVDRQLDRREEGRVEERRRGQI